MTSEQGGVNSPFSKSKKSGAVGESTHPHQTEFNCTFESHLKKLRADNDPKYFITDIEGSSELYNIFMQLGVNSSASTQYGRQGCFNPREIWDYDYISEDKQCKIRILFVNKFKQPNLKFMRTGEYQFDQNDSGTIRVEMEHYGKNYYSTAAINNKSAGSYFEVTEYNATDPDWRKLRIAFRFHVNLKSSDGSVIKLRNAMLRSGTIGE